MKEREKKRGSKRERQRKRERERNREKEKEIVEERKRERRKVKKTELMKLFTWIIYLVGHHKSGQNLVKAGVQIPIHENPEK